MTERLSQFDFIHELSPEGANTLAGHLTLHRAEPGRVLINKGDRVGGVYLIEQGTLRVYQLGPTGREQTLYWAGPGESCLLAVSCLFSDMHYPAWVEVDDEEALVGIVDADGFRQLFQTEPVVQRFTFNVLSRRVVELTEALAEAGTLDVEQRIISLLIRRCGDDSFVRLNQERIAKHVGTAREVVSRTLRTLAADGLLRGHRGAVEVLDLAALSGRLPME